ncbi:hypothetical protein BT63DRAFT_418876 [Microthyrium microscopicum]|uniref:Uncharacterized protein n=1 Tax=Microthyrium microscopicum TaxID=703497 RepID=A0A6A6TZB4_9PEZI|nr:hypothetical protein BT63DRAFT_418876 [Microthyrium microscopicum]
MKLSLYVISALAALVAAHGPDGDDEGMMAPAPAVTTPAAATPTPAALPKTPKTAPKGFTPKSGSPKVPAMPKAGGHSHGHVRRHEPDSAELPKGLPKGGKGFPKGKGAPNGQQMPKLTPEQLEAFKAKFGGGAAKGAAPVAPAAPGAMAGGHSHSH